ncbi:site-specific integrase [Gordonia alkaliphila]|uniref:tyrosine-type recombinase/integrase n=1 Tax=Gordonia alkaliphila TaxID=1053547 RepID=UPI001FF484BB|nr:site-specific integrase [Gordonia alkaliphila]MCK0440259.1 site-specific integrase [Gordonia alkaliphila]
MSVQRLKLPSGRVRWRARVYDKRTGDQTTRSFDTKAQALLWERQQRVALDGELGIIYTPEVREAIKDEALAESSAKNDAILSTLRDEMLAKGPEGAPDQEALKVVQLRTHAGTRRQLIVRDFLTDWKDDAETEGTKRLRENLVRQTVPLADLMLNEVTGSAIAEWQRQLRKSSFISGEPLSTGSVRMMTRMLNSAFEVAVKRDLIEVNPCSQIEKGRKGTGVSKPMPTDVMSVNQVHDLIARLRSSSAALGVMAEVASKTGLRIGELAGLRIGSLNTVTQELSITEQAAGGRTAAWKPLKSSTSKRRLKVIDSAFKALTGYIAQYRGGEPLTAPLFVTEGGSQYNASHAGKKLRDLNVGHTWHDFRHFYASQLIAAGADLPSVSKALGHASTSVTLDVYVHLLPGAEDRVHSAIASAFGEEVSDGESKNSPEGESDSG